jgi:hypothetical protein
VAEYKYHDEKGAYLFSVCRFEPKGFAQRTAAGWGLNGTRRVLYRLPRVLEAIAEEELVFVVEGEKDVDNLEKIGLYATTSPMGAGKWRDEYSDSLQWALACIIPDNDGPGRAHAEHVGRSLQGKAKSVQILTLDQGKDVSDWLATGGTKDELLKLAAAAPCYDSNVLPDNIEPKVKLWTPDESYQLIKGMLETEPMPFPFLIPKLIPEGVCGWVYGSGGSCKSLAMLWLHVLLAVKYTCNFKWLDKFQLDGEPIATMYCSIEDEAIDFHHRIYPIIDCIRKARPDVSRESLIEACARHLHLFPRERWMQDGCQYVVDHDGNPTIKKDRIIEYAAAQNIKLVTIDTFSRACDAEENDNRLGARYVSAMELIRDGCGANVITIDHTAKSGRLPKGHKQSSRDVHDQNGLRGAASKIDNSRFGLSFHSIGKNKLEITHSKPFRCMRVDPFEVEVDFPAFKLIEDSENVEDDLMDAVVEDVRANPGTTQRLTRQRLKKDQKKITQGFKDAVEAGEIEDHGKGNGWFIKVQK